MIGNMADLNIMKQGEESFLKLPHKSAHRSQIDIEAKADENKLIIPGYAHKMSLVINITFLF